MKTLKIGALIIGASLSLAACTSNIETTRSNASTDEAIAMAAKTNLNIAFSDEDVLNNQPTKLGVLCSAYKYNMNLGNDLTATLSAMDKDGALNNTQVPDVTVIAKSADSTLKCVQTSFAGGKCQTKLNVSGKLVYKNGTSKPFNISKEAIQKTSMCEGARGSIKEASASALADIKAMVAQ